MKRPVPFLSGFMIPLALLKLLKRPVPFLLVVGTALFWPSLAVAEEAEVVLLWPDGAPGAVGESEADIPTLTLYPAPIEKRSSAGVIVCPGGGYATLATDHEGLQVARWLNSAGVSAFVLRYRHGTRYQHPAPLQDAQRALRFVRQNRSRWGLQSNRIGILGFSAGGHLASTAGTHFDAGNPKSSDPVERFSSRPDFMVLVYPVISFTTEYTHQGSRRHLLGEDPEPALVEAFSNEFQVTAETPATFLVHSDDDQGVAPQNSVLFYLALQEAGVPAEMHIFRRGGHGYGLAPLDSVLDDWTDLCLNWMTDLGLLGPSP